MTKYDAIIFDVAYLNQWIKSATDANVEFIYAKYGFGDFKCAFKNVNNPTELLNILL